jgi:murein DD-endopeptidase MepM/ murein hydrolase activator NlpD
VQQTGSITLDQGNTTAYPLPESCLLHPLRLAKLGSDLYALDSAQLKKITLGPRVSCQPIVAPAGGVEGTVVQELGDFAPSGDGSSLLLLDRAGNVFRYFPDDESWRVERLANAEWVSSRQYLVSVSAYQDEFYLLDTNVGEIWRHAPGVAEILTPDVDLRESVDLAVGAGIFVLGQESSAGRLRLLKLSGYPLRPEGSFSPPSDLDNPSLLFVDLQSPKYLYVIDQNNHRLRVLAPESGGLIRDYVLDKQDAEILAAHGTAEKMYLASTGALYVYPQEPTGPGDWTSSPPPISEGQGVQPHDPRVLASLPSLKLPLEGTAITDLSFRLPGAPRSYRYGVHEGIDFYWAAGQTVTSTTAVLSVAPGQVIRADREYDPPTLQEMEAMLASAAELSHTTEEILDVLRGRQVWIDHGGGVVSRYCHLSAVAADLELGDPVPGGQVIGYVGNSGTPASYYDEYSEIHLHLEIRIGEGYLGQYLRPAEVKRWLQLAFSGGA